MAAGKTRLRADPEKSQRTVWETNRDANGPDRGSVIVLLMKYSNKTAKPLGRLVAVS